MATVTHGVGRGVLPVLAACLVAGTLPAQARRGIGVPLSDVPLPGGLSAARQAIDDRGTPSRALFLVEAIRRFYDAPDQSGDDQATPLRALLTHLARSSEAATSANGLSTAPAILPLPLTEAWWIEAVFHGQSRPDTLAASILQSRDAALLYWSLLALDTPTRLWMADRQALVDRLMNGYGAAFAAAAPALHVASGSVDLPGGKRARDAWESLVGAKASDAEAFVGGLLQADDGRLAAFFTSLSRLPDARLEELLEAGADDPAPRLDRLHRLYAVFARASRDWTAAAHPFSSPPRDPMLVVSEFTFEDGGLKVPRSRGFWQHAFDRRVESDRPGPRQSDSASADLAWLLDQVYDTGPNESRLRVEQVLFERDLEPLSPDAFGDAVATLVALGRYPSLVRTLQRLHVTDAAVYRRAVDRAATLSAIPDRGRRLSAIAQFQGALALVARATTRGSLGWHDVPALVSTLSAVETSERGGYDGRLARWIDDRLRPRVPPASSDARETMSDGSAPGVEVDLLRLLAGRSPIPPRHVEWEGAAYRVDPAAAEAQRLDRVRGEAATHYLTAAWDLLAIADRLGTAVLSPDVASHESHQLQRVAREEGWEARDSTWPPDTVDRYHALARDFGEAARSGSASPSSRLTRPLRLLADDFVAHGLTELAYAAALGEGDASPILSEDAAGRHDFGTGPGVGDAPVEWRLPEPSARTDRPWHLAGALLGLDVSLADRWLRRVSLKPPAVPPSLDDDDRQALVEAVVMEPTSLTDVARDEVALALRAGRTRVQSATAGDVERLGDSVGLDPVRRSLLPWVFEHERDRLGTYFSTAELFWLGSGADHRGELDAWGAPARPRSGCLCLWLPGRWARRQLTGHPEGGLLMSTFPDLNLRLAELLADLGMPAILLPGVLEPATWDLVQQSPARYPGDLRGLAEHVHALTLDQVEQYLALLTTDGPLVPIEASAERPSGSPR
jgi:hypothetical protein